MINAILESIQKNLGITSEKFKKRDFYEKEKANAAAITAAFNQLAMVIEFRACSEGQSI